MHQKIWTPPELVEWISNDFAKRGFSPPHRLEAEYLVSHGLNITRLQIYLQYDKPCTTEEQQAVRVLVKRRYRGEPVAYILGSCEFWSLELEVGPGVLIPRQDTEILVEAMLENLPPDPLEPQTLLELGTGSACIPLAIASERENVRVLATEYSRQALGFAVKNIRKYRKQNLERKNRIQPILGDRLLPVKEQAVFDAIISNPPYVRRSDMAGLQQEIRRWEPQAALDGGLQGLDFYEYLKNTSGRLLKPGGVLAFEHGYDQFREITGLMETSSDFTLQKAYKDYNHQQRVMVFKRI